MIAVPVLHCPKCGSKLEIYKGGQIWTVRCYTCNAQVEIGGRNKDLLDAYEAYIQAVNSGTVGTGTGPQPAKTTRPRSTLVEEEGTGKRRVHRGGEKKQSREDIAKAVAAGGSSIDELPDALRPLIESGKDYLVTYHYNTATDAEYGCSTDELKIPSRLKALLQKRGISRLYRFQEQAFKEIQNGKDVVLAAPTGQGKTEAFVLPIFSKLLATTEDVFGNPGIRALLVYPTKALARDQYDKLEQMCAASSLSLGIFDGDVPANQRESCMRARRIFF